MFTNNIFLECLFYCFLVKLYKKKKKLIDTIIYNNKSDFYHILIERYCVYMPNIFFEKPFS